MVYFVHLSAKPAAGVVPVDAWWNGHFGSALSPPPLLDYILPSSFRASYGPLGSSRSRNQGGDVGVWDTGPLWDQGQGGECQQNERFDSPFVGLNPRRSTVARVAVGTAILVRRVRNLFRLDPRVHLLTRVSSCWWGDEGKRVGGPALAFVRRSRVGPLTAKTWSDQWLAVHVGRPVVCGGRVGGGGGR